MRDLNPVDLNESNPPVSSSLTRGKCVAPAFGCDGPQITSCPQSRNRYLSTTATVDSAVGRCCSSCGMSADRNCVSFRATHPAARGFVELTASKPWNQCCGSPMAALSPSLMLYCTLQAISADSGHPWQRWDGLFPLLCVTQFIASSLVTDAVYLRELLVAFCRQPINGHAFCRNFSALRIQKQQWVHRTSVGNA